LTGAFRGSLLAVALFAVHPLRVEPVAWAAARKHVLAAFFLALSLLAWRRHLSRPAPGRYLAALALFALGLAANPMLAVLPALLLLLDWWPLGRFPVGQPVRSGAAWLIREKIPFLALSCLAAVLAFLAQSEGGNLSSLTALPFSLRLTNAVSSAAAYLRQAAWPIGLSFFYEYPMDGIPFARLGLSLLLLATITALASRERRRRPWLAMGWGWYLVTLLPVIGLIQVGAQSMADRYTYLPLVGPFLAGSLWLTGIADERRSARLPAVLLAGTAVLTCALLTVRQVGSWRDEITLWTRALEVAGERPVAHNHLGLALEKAGRAQEAEGHFRSALRLAPDYGEAFGNLGALLAAGGRTREAAESLARAAALEPRSAVYRNNLGLALHLLGRRAEAEASVEEALRLDPDHPEAHNNRGLLWATEGRVDRAEQEFRRAVELREGYAEARVNLGRVLLTLGDPGEALVHLRRAAELKPDDAALREQLREAERAFAVHGARAGQ
jgi:Flp pilus assembly protein TadD